MDEVIESLQDMLLKKETKSEHSESKDLHFDCPNVGAANYTNINSNDNIVLKPKDETMSFPLKIHKRDEEFNHVSLNLIPELKVDTKSKLKADNSTHFERKFGLEVNASVGAEAELKEPTSINASVSKCPDVVYLTNSTVPASHEFQRECLNPVVVLKRLSFPVVGSIQTKERSANTARRSPAFIGNKVK